MMAMLDNISDESGFYQVENSSYIKWFLEQNVQIRSSQSLIHFVYTTIDDIIEVIDLEEPGVLAK